jgi:hypothetical protein
MLGYVEMQYVPPIMRDPKEAVQLAKGQRRHREEVHGRDDFAVIAQERSPAFRGFCTPRRFAHPAQHCSLRNVEAQHFEFTVNARGSPHRVLCNHAENQIAQFLTHAPSSAKLPMPGEPGPVQLEPNSMPANDCFGSNEDQGLLPPGPDLLQQGPKESIGIRKSRSGMMSRENRQLLSQSQIFKKEMVPCV